jgi:leader peptidase (prepilin peptidase)/N-methyltransferase
MFGAGIYLGFKLILLALFVGCLFGGIAGVVMLAAKRATRKTAIAFGPYLAAGILVSALWGTVLISRHTPIL